MKTPSFPNVTGRATRLPVRRHQPVAALFVLLVSCLLTLPALAVFGDGEETEGALIVSEIRIEGNTRTDAGIILRQLGFGVGDPVAFADIDRAWDTLEDCGYFAFVDVVDEEIGDGRTVVIITVEEEQTFAYNLMLGYGERHKYELGGYVQEANLRGKGETLRCDFTALYAQRARLSWQRPWLFGVRGLAAEVAGSYFNGQFVFRPTDWRQACGELDMHYTGSSGLFVRTGAAYRHDDYGDEYVWFNHPADVAEDGLTGTHPAAGEGWLALTLATGFDSRNNHLYPSYGVFSEVGLRYWRQADDDHRTYAEGFADLRAFVPLPIGKHVLALRGYGRSVGKPAHLSNMLFWGGAESLRGYPLGTLEGDHGLLLSAEYRIPLFLMPLSVKGELLGLGLHAFYDWGKTWYELPGKNLAATEDPLYSFGAGAHINFMSQQFRFEGACNRDGDWRFQFADTFNF